MKKRTRKRKANPKTCKHKWERMRCGCGLICHKCDSASTDPMDDPGPTKDEQIGMLRASVNICKDDNSRLKSELGFWILLAFGGWIVVAITVVAIAYYNSV